MTKGGVSLLLGSLGAIIASGLACAMWMANGMVYGSLVGLKDREHDLSVAGGSAVIALTAAILFQAIGIFATASWLPRRQLTGIVGTTVRFALALAVSLAGTGLVLALLLLVIRSVH